MRYRRIIVGVAAAVVVVDAVTKAVAAHALAGEGAVHVVGGLHLLLYRNYGGPAGLLPDQPVVVSCLVIAALACMVFAVRLVDSARSAVAGDRP